MYFLWELVNVFKLIFRLIEYVDLKCYVDKHKN